MIALKGTKLWFEYKDTNFESYSQQSRKSELCLKGCDSSTKIQILKAIHNTENAINVKTMLWFEYKDTNFESYSQLKK